LVLASAAAVAAKRLSAARRHMLWLAALLSCVWLALSSPLVPAIMIHTPMLAQAVVGTATPPTAAAVPNVGSAMLANAPRVRERLPSTPAVRRSTLPSIPLPSHPFIALWIIGCVALLVRHAVGFLGASRLARRASIANDDETARELAGVAAAIGVRREVRLGYSTEVRTPITFDVPTPYVLLPIEARSWSIERRRAVLVHETAHIARGDWLSQAIGRLACELFWFHPLVWRAFARLRAEAEHAADDCVLRSGMPAGEYATHLLELARRTTDAQPDLVAIGIVSTNDLERRFRAMFDIKRSRTTVTSRARAITTSVALAVVCPLASLRVAAPAKRMNAPLSHVPMQRVPLARVSLPQPASATPAATGARDIARVPQTPAVYAAVVERAAPSSVVHPDLSGRWASDTVALPPQSTNYWVTDSLIIRQSKDSIALRGRAHMWDTPIGNLFHNITFDGVQSSGVTFTGTQWHAQNVVVSAVWMGDTLVLDSHVYASDHDNHTIERMTLGADRNTLSTTTMNFLDGKLRYGWPLTSIVRRMTP
jgi:beta-lactamase regulating signal transducer with metallopeptidase domain